MLHIEKLNTFVEYRYCYNIRCTVLILLFLSFIILVISLQCTVITDTILVHF